MTMNEIGHRFSGWKPGDPIGYIRAEIPAVLVPSYVLR